jgi:hypothetical protein
VFAVAVMWSGCGAASTPPQQRGLELGDAVAPADGSWWKRADCPTGTTLRDSWYPHSGEVWCETADGVRHGPFARWTNGTTDRSSLEGLYDRGVEHGSWRHSTEEGITTTTYDRGRVVVMRQVLSEAARYCDPSAEYVLSTYEGALHAGCELPGGVRHGMFHARVDGFTIEGHYRAGVPVGEWSYRAGDRSTTINRESGERVDFVYVGDSEWDRCTEQSRESERIDALCTRELPRVP